MFDYQYVYLMRKKGSRQHKIGISKKPNRRLNSVRRGVGADVRIIICRKVLFAHGVERFLHGYFAATRFFFFFARKEAGRTEWFRLNFLERWTAGAWILFFGLIPQVLLILAIGYALLKYDQAFGLFP